jgi:NAD(P)H-quinone oxidoreductase subunit 6
MMMQGVEVLLEQAEFIAVAVVVLLLAYLALEHKEITYSVFFFGFMAAAVSGFFLLLDAPFLVGIQIAVYTGGISALIIFGVLLLPRAQAWPATFRHGHVPLCSVGIPVSLV